MQDTAFKETHPVQPKMRDTLSLSLKAYQVGAAEMALLVKALPGQVWDLIPRIYRRAKSNSTSSNNPNSLAAHWLAQVRQEDLQKFSSQVACLINSREQVTKRYRCKEKDLHMCCGTPSSGAQTAFTHTRISTNVLSHSKQSNDIKGLIKS